MAEKVGLTVFKVNYYHLTISKHSMKMNSINIANITIENNILEFF